MSDNWTDRLAGARMQVDQRFQRRLDQSEFTSQEWGLVMTAIEFEIEHADDPERANLVANTEKLEQIIPELDNIQREMGGAARPVESSADTSGVFGKLKEYLGHLGSDTADTPSDDERMKSATILVTEYADELQAFLEERDRWDEIREAAAESES